MKKIVTLVMAMLCLPIISNANENMELSVTRDSKSEWTLSVALNNENTYAGFQMDLVMPAPFAFSTENITKTSRTRLLTVQANTLPSGNIRIVCYSSTKNRNIVGTMGDVLTIKLNPTTDVAAGTYDIVAKNIRVSNSTDERVLPGINYSFDVAEIPQHTINYWNADTLYHSASIEEGDSIPAIADPEAREGFTFCGWGDTLAVMPDHDVDLYATWCRQSFVINYVVNGQTIHSEPVAYGDSIKLYDYEADEAHVFIKWLGDAYETMPAHDITYEAQLALLGDVDLDGVINSSDIVSVYNYIINGEESGIIKACADVNGDGTINSADVTTIYNLIINGTSLSSKAYHKALIEALK